VTSFSRGSVTPAHASLACRIVANALPMARASITAISGPEASLTGPFAGIDGDERGGCAAHPAPVGGRIATQIEDFVEETGA